MDVIEGVEKDVVMVYVAVVACFGSVFRVIVGT
jgi:hypothetical protein